MKKTLLSLLLIAITFSAKSQSYLGYTHDNYAGVQSVLFNPASIADSRFKTDVNLFSISGTVANDLYGVRLFDVYKKGYDWVNESDNVEANKILLDENLFIISVEISKGYSHS